MRFHALTSGVNFGQGNKVVTKNWKTVAVSLMICRMLTGDLITKSRAAVEFQISRKTVQRWVKKGLISDCGGRVSRKELAATVTVKKYRMGYQPPGRKLGYRPKKSQPAMRALMVSRARLNRLQGYYVPRVIEGLHALSDDNLAKVLDHGLKLIRSRGKLPLSIIFQVCEELEYVKSRGRLDDDPLLASVATAQEQVATQTNSPLPAGK